MAFALKRKEKILRMERNKWNSEGIGEGQGQNNVSDQIEFEEQVWERCKRT